MNSARSAQMDAELREIVERLGARSRDVGERYAPGGFVQGHRYWACCPWRDDARPNTFYVNISGSYEGWFYDHATAEKGDMLTLIRRATEMPMREAIAEARRFLGMVNETPEQRRLRLQQVEKSKRLQRQAAKDAAANAVKRSRLAQHVFLRARTDWDDSPAADYLAARGITAAALGRLPRAIRFEPAMRISQTDKETGEVFEGEYPTLVTAVHGSAEDGAKPRFLSVQLHYLAHRPDPAFWRDHLPDKIMHPDPARRWWKADIPKPKAYFYGAPKKGGFVRLWAGSGPRGGKGAPLAQAAGTVWIAEGIEDGLSAAVLNPTRRVLAALDLGNLVFMELPASITEIVLIADRDPKPEQIAQLEAAAKRFRDQGRAVTVWMNDHGGKDLNDALLQALAAERQRDEDQGAGHEQ